jgi:hypothetical protein
MHRSVYRVAIPLTLTFLCGARATEATAQDAASHKQPRRQPLVIAEQGSFSVAGRGAATVAGH